MTPAPAPRVLALRLVLLLALALAACTSPIPVLQLPVLSSCDLAQLGESGDPCNFSGACFWSETTSSDGCCTVRGTCAQGRLSATRMDCRPQCEVCGIDFECVYGEAVCNDSRCTPCPELDASCAPCFPGWVPLGRNGCPSCDCAPPSQCSLLNPSSCPSPNTCHLGSRCAEGCDAPDCCVNLCTGSQCSGPAPEGCPVSCRITPDCSACALEGCVCTPASGGGIGRWTCHERCVEPVVVPECRFAVIGVEVVP